MYLDEKELALAVEAARWMSSELSQYPEAVKNVCRVLLALVEERKMINEELARTESTLDDAAAQRDAWVEAVRDIRDIVYSDSRPLVDHVLEHHNLNLSASEDTRSATLPDGGGK